MNKNHGLWDRETFCGRLLILHIGCHANSYARLSASVSVSLSGCLSLSLVLSVSASVCISFCLYVYPLLSLSIVLIKKKLS